MHVFKYSRRKGTKADKMPNQISPKIQEERSKKIIELSNNNELNYNNEMIGKTVEVLFEEKDKDYIKGHTQNYMVVKVKNNDIDKHHNKIEKVNIIGTEGAELLGKLMM